jgi:nucleoside-diphosphate-sugar epimerase
MYLLTGSSGFLGKIIQQKLLSLKGEKVLTLSAKGIGTDIKCDLSKEHFECKDRISMVIHCAGKAHSIPKSKEDVQEFYNVNFTGTMKLCESLVNARNVPDTFVFISTVAVYGVEEGILIDETSHLIGSTPYAVSKIKAEEYLGDWCKRNNVNLFILRLPLIAGKYPPGNLGAMINGIQSGRYLSIGNASARKSVVMATDIANLIPELAGKKGGVYNLTDGYHPSFSELEDLISKELTSKQPRKIPLWFAKGLARLGDMLGNRAPLNSLKLSKIISTLTFNDKKARELLGWNPDKVINVFKIK